MKSFKPKMDLQGRRALLIDRLFKRLPELRTRALELAIPVPASATSARAASASASTASGSDSASTSSPPVQPPLAPTAEALIDTLGQLDADLSATVAGIQQSDGFWDPEDNMVALVAEREEPIYQRSDGRVSRGKRTVGTFSAMIGGVKKHKPSADS